MDDNKDIKQIKTVEKNIEKIENKIVFNNNDRYKFVFKKHERLVAGLYLITNLLSDNEPLKWQIRKSALEALTQSLILTKANLHDRTHAVASCGRALSELIALCQVAYIAKYISDMNYAILSKEFSMLLEAVEGLTYTHAPQTALVLSNDFFAVPEPLLYKKTQVENKGQITNSEGDGKTQESKTEDIQKDSKKDDRRTVILKMLQNNEKLSIKDFSQKITDCSEKTIQRELLALVDDGVLNKIGERRWSVYSLKQ